MMDISKKELIEIIYNHLKLANHYFQDWKEIEKQRDSDEGKIYRKYNFSLALIKKAYFENTILTLCRLLEKNGTVNFYKLRRVIETSKNIEIESFDKKYSRNNQTIKKVKKIRDESIAHNDEINLNKLYEETGIYPLNVDDLLLDLLEYLKYLVEKSDVKLNYCLTYPYNRSYGINEIYQKLE